MERKTSIKSKLVAVILLVTVFFTVALSGCTSNSRVSGIEFKVSKLELIVEEEREITSSIVSVLPSFAENKDFTLSSSDESILKVIDGVKLRGMKKGEVTLTATSNGGGYTDTCPVYVNYSSIRTMKLKMDGKNIQHTGSVSNVTLSVQCNGIPDPITPVNWYINGELSKTLKLNENLEFTPDDVSGTTTIKAEVKSSSETMLSESTDIKVYSEILTPTVDFDESAIIQNLTGFKPIEFAVSFTENANDPIPTINWFIDGSLSGTEKTFSFAPTKVGIYRVTCMVNGYVASFSDSEFVLVTAKGILMPSNLSFEFDNSFPKMYLKWNGMPSNVDYTVKIVNNATGVNISPNLNTKNTSVQNFFTDNSVEISSFINTDSASIFNTTYSISLRSDGDKSGVYTASEFTEPIVTAQVSPSAKAYLEKSYYNGNENYYITSEDEFAKFFAYSMLWRVSNAKLYLAYNPNMDGNELIKKVFDKMSFTGEYSYLATINTKTNILDYSMTFKTDLTPTKYTKNASSSSIDAMMPHINYDKEKGIGADFYFPIKLKPSVEVKNTEQLYYVSQSGYNPVPTLGSKANTYYTYAKKLLGYIITADMTDADIAHAIYDWIMWRVNYDFTVVEEVSSIAESVKYSAYYIEGVLTDLNFNAVCDGMSKTFALLCNMMGIPCVRVPGFAGTTTTGGHAWNKALIDGKWYLFDCTWGDTSIYVGYDVYESASHQYMFLTDAQVSSTHFETSSPFIPATTNEVYNWYDKDFEYNGKSMDFFLSSSGNSLSLECSGLANYLFNSIPPLNQYGQLEYYASFNELSNGSRSVSDYYGIEIKIHPNLRSEFLTAKGEIRYDNPIDSAFARSGYEYGSDYIYSVIDGFEDSLVMFLYAVL